MEVQDVLEYFIQEKLICVTTGIGYFAKEKNKTKVYFYTGRVEQLVLESIKKFIFYTTKWTLYLTNNGCEINIGD